MELSAAGVVILIASALVSFALGRWWSRRRRDKKAAQARAAERAGQSRQVRRARARRAQR